MKTVTVPGKITKFGVKMIPKITPQKNCTPSVSVAASGFPSGIEWEQDKQQVFVMAQAEAGRVDVNITVNGCDVTVSFIVSSGYYYYGDQP